MRGGPSELALFPDHPKMKEYFPCRREFRYTRLAHSWHSSEPTLLLGYSSINVNTEKGAYPSTSTMGSQQRRRVAVPLSSHVMTH